MTSTISTLQSEARTYPPPPEFAARPTSDREAFDRAEADPVAFWEDAARRLDWADALAHRAHVGAPGPTTATGELTRPARRSGSSAGGSTSPSTASTGTSPPAAATRSRCTSRASPATAAPLTYADLQREVARAAHALTALGVGPGDRVVVYLPVLAETVDRHARDRADRRDALPRVRRLLRRGRAVPGAGHRRQAARHQRRAVPPRRRPSRSSRPPTRPSPGWTTSSTCSWCAAPGQDVPWTDGPRRLVARRRRHRARRARGRGLRRRAPAVRHLHLRHHRASPRAWCTPSGGYLTHAAWAHWAHFDAKPDDVHWCTADLAWVTAHTYEIYGPLSNGLTQVIYEGTPDTPAPRAPPRDHRALRRDHVLHGAHPDPDVHDLVRRRAARRARPVEHPAARARSARRSTPRRGCGSARTFGARPRAGRRHVVAVRDRAPR